MNMRHIYFIAILRYKLDRYRLWNVYIMPAMFEAFGRC